MSRKLREIYEYDLIEDDDMDNAVDEWFNTIMEKTKDQLSLADVSRMLRQKICSRVAIKRAIEMLSDDPFVGEMFEGQLMFNLYNGKEKYLKLFYDELLPIIEQAELSAIGRVWSSNDEKTEYLKIASAFKHKIAEAKAAACSNA